MCLRCPKLLFANHAGFTLVELLLAVGLSAVVALIAYTGISNGSAAVTQVADEVALLTEVQRTFSVMEEDLQQLRQRPITRGVGLISPAFIGDSNDQVLLEFTRGGVANPLQLPRSELQRVRYERRDQQLWRLSWTQLDVPESQSLPQEMLLLTNSSAISVEFLPSPTANSSWEAAAVATAGFWEVYWNSEDPQRALVQPLPLAIRVSLELPGMGQVRRVYAL